MNIEENEEVFEFLRGYVDTEGHLNKEFQITEMSGEDEEAISKKDTKANAGKVVRVILERCITRMGEHTRKSLGTAKWREAIQSLSIGDQDFALMKIREETLGNEIEVLHNCPECEQELNTIIETDELEIKDFNGLDILDFELPKGFKDKKGVVHKSGTMRYPNGLDRETLNQLIKTNTGMANTMLLTRCIINLGDLTVYDQVIRKLSIRDREYLLKILQENDFGLDMSTEITCTACGTSFKGNLNSTNFI